MMVFEQLSNCDDIHNLLLEFDDCFPHLKDKVENYLEFSKKLQKYAIVIVAKNNNENIGLSCFYANNLDDFCGYITLIGVKSDRRGSGVGKSLLYFTEDIMKQKGMKLIKLEVDSDNFNAQQFYLKNGFVVSDKMQNSFYMVKEFQL